MIRLCTLLRSSGVLNFVGHHTSGRSSAGSHRSRKSYLANFFRIPSSPPLLHPSSPPPLFLQRGKHMSENNTSTPSVPHVYDGYSWAAESGKAPAVEQFVGMIRNGPASVGQGSDYSDARDIHVDRAIPNPADAAALLTAKVDPLPGVAQVVTATNLAEVAAGSHLLVPGTLVQVAVVYPQQPAGKSVCHQPPAAGLGGGENLGGFGGGHV